MDAAPLALHLPSLHDTEAIAARFALAAPAAADHALSVHLAGELGAGKTTWVRGFLRALGVSGPIRSPTYTLLETYSCSALEVLHLDLYRLEGPEELEALGLRELHRAGYVWLIEWPQRAAGALPPPDLEVTLMAGAAGHDFRAVGHGQAGCQWLQRVAATISSET